MMKSIVQWSHSDNWFVFDRVSILKFIGSSRVDLSERKSIGVHLTEQCKRTNFLERSAISESTSSLNKAFALKKYQRFNETLTHL
jgi:hypothetical protein